MTLYRWDEFGIRVPNFPWCSHCDMRPTMVPDGAARWRHEVGCPIETEIVQEVICETIASRARRAQLEVRMEEVTP